MGIIIKDKNIAIVSQGMSDTRNLERENSDIRMSTVENQETQMIVFLAKRKKNHFTDRRTIQIPIFKFPKIQEHQSIKTHLKRHRKILNITPLSKKKKKREGQSVKKGKNSSNIWKQKFTKTKTLFNIKIAPGNSDNNYKLPKNTKGSTYTIHKYTIKREEKAWNLRTCSHERNEKNPPKDDQENVRKIKRTKYKN